MDCEFVKDNGERCGATALKEPAPDGRRLCYWHHPATEEARAASARAGGLASQARRRAALQEPVPAPASMADVEALLMREIGELLSFAEPGVKRASCLSSLSRALVTVSDATSVRTELKRLARAVGLENN